MSLRRALIAIGCLLCYSHSARANRCVPYDKAAFFQPSLFGGLRFQNPFGFAVNVLLFHPQARQSVFASWNIPAGGGGNLSFNNKPLAIADDWGIAVQFPNGGTGCVYSMRYVAGYSSGNFDVAAPMLVDGPTWMNTFGVGDHQACGNNNLSGVVPEVEKLIRSTHLPVQSIWFNRDVNAGVLRRESDQIPGYSSSGYLGAESGTVAYFSTHGGTSNGVYSLSVNHDGVCRVSSREMFLGDGDLRYLFLSTCQSVKIGNGMDPRVAGENPFTTWSPSVNGLACVLGYSSNESDSDRYGQYFNEIWRGGQSPIVSSFLNASERVTRSQVPAVICFGRTVEEAKSTMELASIFDHMPRSSANASWVWRDPVKSRVSFDAPPETSLSLPVVLEITRDKVDLARWKRAFPEAEFVAKGGRRRGGSATLSLTSRGIVYENIEARRVFEPVTYDDNDAISIATSVLAERGLSLPEARSVGGTVVHESGADTSDPTPHVLRKIVIFKQLIAGLSALGAEGETRVELNARGGVVSIAQDRLRVRGTSIKRAVSSDRFVDLARAAHEAAYAEARRLWPKSTIVEVDSERGYRVDESGTSASLVVSTVLETTDGPAQKRHVFDKVIDTNVR